MNIKLISGIRLSKNLVSDEVINASSGDISIGIDPVLPIVFESLRKYSGGKPLRINSAIRAPGNGVTGSAHFTGQAFDVHLDPDQKSKLKENLDDFLGDTFGNLYGFGVYPNFVHIDVKDKNVKNTWHSPGKKSVNIRHWSDRGEPLWLRLGSGGTTPEHGEKHEKKIDDLVFSDTTFIAFSLLVLAFLISRK